jgi:chromosomal replication initiator protein
LKVADSPGVAYNPLFLYGGVGLGKTHLMHAIGNFLFNKNRSIKIVYLHAERFVRDMVRSLQINSINEFKQYYRSVDTLLIDDIQFFSGREKSQEEFFHTFNDLLDGGQQVILTCDRYPEKISGINERLRSRFCKGLTVAIETPDLKTRIAILKQKANKYNVVLPENVANFIASRVNANIRELEGALKRIIASSNFLNEKITIDLTKDALKDVIALYDKQVDITDIQNIISDYYKIPVIDIISKSRNKAIVLSRQMGMAISKELTDCSFPEIGKAFGGKDHTTVIHACSKIKQLVEYNPEMQKDFKYLIKHLVD